MGICLYGSQKKPDSQAFFSVSDSGAFCSLLNINATICPLLDIIPSLIGLPWRKIIEKIGKASFSLLLSEATGQIDTAIFCSLEPPKLPDDINYADVFAWILSYVPVIGGFVIDDPLLKKITAYYLYAKWFELCECKKRPEIEPPDGSIDNIPPFLPSCDASAIYQSVIQGAIDLANQRNINQGGTLANFISFSDGGSVNFITRTQYNNALAYYLSPPAPLFLSSESTSISGFQTNYSASTIGCMQFATRGGFYYSNLRVFQIGNSSTGRVDAKYLGVDIFQTQQIKYSESNCCPIPPPPTLKPPTSQNPPIAPPDFCDLFPNNPLCPQNPCDIESINILLFDGCGKPRKSATRILFKSGQNLPVDVSVFDGCGTIRKIEAKILFNC